MKRPAEEGAGEGAVAAVAAVAGAAVAEAGAGAVGMDGVELEGDAGPAKKLRSLDGRAVAGPGTLSAAPSAQMVDVGEGVADTMQEDGPGLMGPGAAAAAGGDAAVAVAAADGGAAAAATAASVDGAGEGVIDVGVLPEPEVFLEGEEEAGVVGDEAEEEVAEVVAAALSTVRCVFVLVFCCLCWLQSSCRLFLVPVLGFVLRGFLALPPLLCVILATVPVFAARG